MIDWMAGNALPLGFLGAYLLAMVWHGWQGHRSTHDVTDYYIGGRAMGGTVLALSFYATYFSTNSFVGFAGESYTVGFAWLAMGLILLAFATLSWHLVAPRLRAATERLGAITVADYLGLHYRSDAVRLVAAAVIIVSSLIYMTAIFKGAGTTLEAFLGIRYEVAIVLVLVIVVVYTAYGGFISVVKTDAVQGTLMLASGAYMIVAVLRAGGGPTALLERVAATPGVAADGQPLGEVLLASTGGMSWPLLLGIACAGGAKFLCEPRQLMRFYALRDRAALRRAMVLAPMAIAVSYLCLLPLGVLARGLLADGSFVDTDRVIPALLSDPTIVSPIAGAVILTTLIAAAMSSLDSVLLVVASTFQRDVVETWRAGAALPANALRNTRLQVVVFALLTGALAFRPPADILSLTVFSGSLYAACLGPPLLGALYWRAGTGRGAVWALVVGLIAVPIWSVGVRSLPAMAEIHEVFPAVLAAALAFVTVSRRSGSDDRARSPR